MSSVPTDKRAEQEREPQPSHPNVSALPTIPPQSLSSQLLKFPQVYRTEGTFPYSLLQCLLVHKLINWHLLTLPCLNTSSILSELSGPT